MERSAVPVRGTQSLVQIQAQCWRRPGLIARELLWRWGFGIPALLLLSVYGQRLLAILFAAHSGIEDFSLQRPLAAAEIIRASYHAVWPALREFARGAGPLLVLAWAVASGAGRSFVLRALTPGRPRTISLVLVQLLRICALVAAWRGWFVMIRWAALREITRLPRGAEPNMVGFAAWLICLSIGSFVVWALWSWILSIASVLIIAEGRGVLSALAASVRLGPLIMKLVVLALVFSAVPLPFEAQMSGNPLYVWWAAVGVLYLLASDFFQVARLAAFVEFWQRRQSMP